MTNPFTAFAFKTSDAASVSRTLPDRLADIKNVKDFGATGDGVTDDWAAIQGAVNWTSAVNRGTVFFPPGTYLVSQPIDFSPISVSVDFNICFLGVFGASIVTGNFSDYVFKRGINDTAGNSGWHTVENLTIINTNATGGGIRIGFSVAPAVRNCIITANKAINTASVDGSANVYSAEVAIENCTLSPGSNPSGSIGISSVSDGPTINCSITGFDLGIHCYGQQGGQTFRGCRIELCGVGISGNASVLGCLFKNCGTAISGGGGFYHGVRVEGTEGTIAGNPQYGIQLNTDSFFNAVFCGIVVTGLFQQFGIDVEGGEAFIERALFFGVQSTNTSTLGGMPWKMPTTPATAQFIGCNTTSVGALNTLPAPVTPLTSISWSGGTTTFVTTANFNPIAGSSITVTIEGVTPSGYNGVFSGATITAFNSLSYSQTNPGSPTGSGGTVVVNAANATGPNAIEGDCYNVSDSNTATWGANPTASGSTHAKVRWNGTNWSIVGI